MSNLKEIMSEENALTYLDKKGIPSITEVDFYETQIKTSIIGRKYTEEEHYKVHYKPTSIKNDKNGYNPDGVTYRSAYSTIRMEDGKVIVSDSKHDEWEENNSTRCQSTGYYATKIFSVEETEKGKFLHCEIKFSEHKQGISDREIGGEGLGFDDHDYKPLDENRREVDKPLEIVVSVPDDFKLEDGIASLDIEYGLDELYENYHNISPLAKSYLKVIDLFIKELEEDTKEKNPQKTFGTKK